ncbi:hypothetical protein FACS1894137_17240 [Spirochaetia bacterium]|nr:hypothetical protein FACS1894137_17240 [Spirochaetia bacterium]
MSDIPTPGNDKRKPKNSGGPLFPFGGPKLPDPKKFGGWRFSIVYILILMIGMSLFNYVVMNKVNPTVDFSEFKNKIASGEIKRVELTDAYFTGYTTFRAEPRRTPRGSANTLGRSSRAAASTDPVYRTVPINDPELVKLMDRKGVSYYAVSREGSTVLNLIFSWVLPIAFFFFIWRFLMKRLGTMGGNVLSVGNSRAKKTGPYGTGYPCSGPGGANRRKPALRGL